ncbi:wd domain-containing protein [Rutstroemia sp. NJR-2017a WRK4]|nr:wd domain-containing protein [Rutstroemia sp. NJR-2017a WRK4]
MAVKEESPYNATEELIRHSPRKYYRASIITSHWQLRSLISSPKQHIIYYPSGTDIIRLNTKSREREIVTTLSFSPRCLVASKDWLCCGGDHGNYTSIYVGGGNSGRDSSPRLGADADARLPLVLDPARRLSHRDSPAPLRSSSPPATTCVKKIGTEIVNCIAIWAPSGTAAAGTYTDPVAVVALNDCTVCILNLHDAETLDKLTFPDFVNRALISPDGELLIAIGDDPFLYLHKRQAKQSGKSRFESKQIVSEYEWAAIGRVQIEGQKQADRTNMRGSFAACFSKSGKYLAVGTQYGAISVYLTSSFFKEDYDPLVVTFTSSRPGHEHGAVRALEFSPSPFDLLAWTESSGRVGVADVRDLFMSRQLINIDAHGDSVERVWVTERLDDTPAIDPRLRSFRTEAASSSPTPDYLGLDFERQQLRNLTRDLADRDPPPPLSADEMELLQAHRMARRQRDAAREAQAQGSSRWGPWDGYTSAAQSANSREDSSGAGRRVSTTGLPGVLRDFVNSDRSPASFRAFIDRQNQDRQRRTQHEPRRRMSSILAASDNALDNETGGSGSGSGRTSGDTYTGLERLSLASRLPHIGVDSRVPNTGSESPNNQWAELEALYRTRFSTDPSDRTTRLRIEVEDDESREFAQRLRQPWRPLEELGYSIEISAARRERRGANVETMGCAWSEDGRILYVGAGDGIHEYHINLTGRKMVPSLVLR